VILPECGMEFARRIADRISERLANDGETPKLAVSLGYSVWPQSGRTGDALIREADRVLYEMKHRHHGNYALPLPGA